MIGWKSDKSWADELMPEIKRILGEFLLCEAPIEEDQERNTDLVVLRMQNVRVACRVRRPDALSWHDEFTIRFGRPSGFETELTKIVRGWGDYLFYGITGYDGNLAAWHIVDLSEFRLWLLRYVTEHSATPGERKANRDGSSDFLAFKIGELPPQVIAARKPYAMAA